jgi:hypothetical protein
MFEVNVACEVLCLSEWVIKISFPTAVLTILRYNCGDEPRCARGEIRSPTSSIIRSDRLTADELSFDQEYGARPDFYFGSNILV